MNKKFWLIPIGILALWLFSCAIREAPSPAPVAPAPVKQVKLDVIEGWQTEWQKTVEAARKEGRVVIYTSSAILTVQEAVPFFREKFGLELEVVGGRGAELRTKLLQEKAAGLHVTDVMIAGPSELLRIVKPAGVTVPLEPALILPEVRDPKFWFRGELPWKDKDRHVIAFAAYPSKVLAINTELVRPDDIKSYFDILDPRWKDKISINDPTLSAGVGFNGFSTLLINKMVDLNFFHQLVDMRSVLTKDTRLQIEWLARGKYPVALLPQTGSMAVYIEAGAPVANIEVKEGTWISAGSSGTIVIDRAPHPNAARVFINWLLTREGQTLMQDLQLIQSAREDIPTTKLDPVSVRTKGKIYFPPANEKEEWILYEQENYQKMAKEVFAPLLK